jgi:hypothetical protein
MDNAEIQSVLQTMGTRVPPASRLVLVGGSALSLLGSPRPTVDIDFIGDDVHPEPLHQTILQIAEELDIDAEPVPLDKFIPLPQGSEGRIIRVGQFGNLEIFIADPYSIALSKLDRGSRGMCGAATLLIGLRQPSGSVSRSYHFRKVLIER